VIFLGDGNHFISFARHKMLSKSALARLKPLILTLRVIVLALAMGVLTFGAFVAVQNSGKPQNIGTNVNYPILTVSAFGLLAGFVVPMFLPKKMNATRDGAPLDPDPKVNAVLGIFAAIQTATIVRCALFEGAAFMNLTFYMINVEVVHAAAAALCLVCILAQFPRSGPIEQQIEERLY